MDISGVQKQAQLLKQGGKSAAGVLGLFKWSLPTFAYSGSATTRGATMPV